MNPLRYSGHSWTEVFDVFGLRAEEARKTAKERGVHERALEAQTFEQKRVLSQDQREAEAMENLRAKIVSKIREVESAAISAAAQMEKARKLANAPEIQGDLILSDLDTQIADMERAVVQIQTGTVVDTASFDTHALAVSYADAQAALIAMNAVRSRAYGAVKSLEERIGQLKREQIRAQQLRQQQRADADLERQRRAALEVERQRRAEQADQERQRQARILALQQLRQLDAEIAREKRALRRARADLATHRAQTERLAAQQVANSARLASIASMRSQFQSVGLQSA